MRIKCPAKGGGVFFRWVRWFCMDKSIVESGGAVIIVLAPEPRNKRGRRERTRTQKDPRREPNYHVVIWNDEEHTYDYVCEMLMTIFSHTAEKAYQITVEVDKAGKGIALTCHKELAELKRDQVLAYGADPTMPEESKGSIRATIEHEPE
jgi:ATP-dependent Clp protease adaptor protein ClpS